jgi:hypothetical protein
MVLDAQHGGSYHESSNHGFCRTRGITDVHALTLAIFVTMRHHFVIQS